MTVTRFEDLEIWQEARELCKIIRQFTLREPFNRDYRFRDQINAASGSIMDNIAEGFDRDGKKEFLQFLSISKGSCGETRSQSYRAFDSEYINQKELDDLLERTQRLRIKIGNFMNYLKKSPLTGTKYKT
jgi:four helix bundle protein